MSRDRQPRMMLAAPGLVLGLTAGLYAGVVGMTGGAALAISSGLVALGAVTLWD